MNILLCITVWFTLDMPCIFSNNNICRYDYPCEAGYYCKTLTALHEMRFLLCPPGFYCKQATGASKKEANTCPTNWFDAENIEFNFKIIFRYCPEGTSGVDITTDMGVVLELRNVQSWMVVDNEGNFVPK